MAQNGLQQQSCESAGTETNRLPTACVVRGAHGMKEFLQNRLAKIRQILSRDHPAQSNETYVAEFDEKPLIGGKSLMVGLISSGFDIMRNLARIFFFLREDQMDPLSMIF